MDSIIKGKSDADMIEDEEKKDTKGEIDRGTEGGFKDNRQMMGTETLGNIDKVVLKQENRSIILLNKDQEHVIDDFKSTEIATYDTIQDINSLLTALSLDTKNKQMLSEWSFITKWHKLSSRAKLSKYDEYFCHELNLFLYLKDTPFFNKVVEPMIKSKLRKDMIDYFLLNDTKHLEKYTQQHLHQRLNSLEMILLAFALKDNQQLRQNTFNYFKQQQEILKISPEKLDKLLSRLPYFQHPLFDAGI